MSEFVKLMSKVLSVTFFPDTVHVKLCIKYVTGCCNQLTSKVDGGLTGSRLRWSTLTCATPQSGNRVLTSLGNSTWSLLNRFRTEQGHCDACRRKWRLTDTDLCPRGETQTMSHIVESCRCPLRKLNGGLSRLHSLRMKMLFHGWPIMVYDTHTRRRRRRLVAVTCYSIVLWAEDDICRQIV